MNHFKCLLAAVAIHVACWPPCALGQQLEQELLGESPAALAAEARQLGDPTRGAIVFHQQTLLCTKCHSTGEPGAEKPLGPDLARPDPSRSADAKRPETYATFLVESVLAPSKFIREGYEPLVLVLADGRSVTGLVNEERSDSLSLRDAGQDGKQILVRKDEIDERSTSKQSIMPTGLANQLPSRQQFLDLIAYLVEIAAHGPARALELKPAPSLVAAAPLPEYEGHIDHAGMIEIVAWDAKSLERGAKIYERVCANCHGTHERPGSLPTSLKFASGKFKNGSDSYAMYQTLTRGFGLMAPQVWMMPRQKYDVIHYVRETYLKGHNPAAFVPIDEAYLARLPKGNTFGPMPAKIEPWVAMDYGNSLIHTYELPPNDAAAPAPNFAYKGIAVRLDTGPGGVSRGEHWSVFDHDTLRMAGAWSRATPDKSFINWKSIQFSGQHEVHPHVAGTLAYSNPIGPGWADPTTGSFDDPRLRGRDDRPYGPLPRAWGRYRGLYHHGSDVIVSYTIGSAEILEMPGYEMLPGTAAEVVFTRTIEIGKASHELVARIAPRELAVALVGRDGAELTTDEQFHLLHIPARETPLVVKVLISRGDQAALDVYRQRSSAPGSLEPLLHGGPPRWPQKLTTRATIGESSGPLAVDVLTHPVENPWSAQVRPTGLDFLDADRAAVCTWDGDVWLVSGLSRLGNDPDAAPELTWQRIASGLFQPLGLKIVKGRIFVTCRDQLVTLHDLNGDGETDFYECFNNDHQVTEHFHEFAMGLQTDDQGAFYYAKSARHARTALVPHHGTLLRISPDGERTDILANGFRAANGVCLNGDGTFVVTDQEGHWTPKNRINWVTPGGFYGNLYGYHDLTDAADEAMQQPLCWITNEFDRSPAELLWVPKGRWGPLGGSLLNFSYGYGKVFVVPHEIVDDQHQGGMCELPLPNFPTGLIRGRFHPHDGQLYACGMYSWASSVTQPGGLYRIRYTGNPIHVPLEIHAARGRLSITFSGPLRRDAVADLARWAIKTWTIRRTANYGSDHYDEVKLTLERATLDEDRRTVHLELPELRPTRCMEIKYALTSSSGLPVRGVVHNTIHALGE